MGNPIKIYNAKLIKTRHRYNVELEVIMDLLDKQSGCCAICSADFGSTIYHIDHDHTTLRVRGLLCSNCNTGIGLLQEDISILNKSIDYINKHKEQ